LPESGEAQGFKPIGERPANSYLKQKIVLRPASPQAQKEIGYIIKHSLTKKQLVGTEEGGSKGMGRPFQIAWSKFIKKRRGKGKDKALQVRGGKRAV